MTALDEERAGLRLLLMRSPARAREWVARCVERVTFEDYATIRRELTLDLRLDAPGLELPAVGPHAADREHPTEGADTPDCEPPPKESSFLLPLVRMPRGQHTTFLATDESGAILPRLTRREERSLVFHGLNGLARSILTVENSPPASVSVAVTERIRKIVEREERPESIETVGTQGADLWRDDSFRNLSTEVYENFYLTAVLKSEPGRRVVQLQYVEQVQTTGGGFGRDDHELPGAEDAHLRLAGVSSPGKVADTTGRVVDRLTGAFGSAFRIDTGSRVVECDSYHFEMVAPYDLRIVGACLYMEKNGTVELEVDDDTSSSSAHMHTSRQSPVNVARVYARLVPVRTGMVRTSVLSAGFISTVLLLGWACSVFSPSIFERLDVSSATAVLLLAPAVLATALAKRSPHSLTTKLLFDARLNVILSSVLLFIAAVAVSLKLSENNMDDLQRVWFVTFVLSVVILARLTVMYLRIGTAVRKDSRNSRST